MKSIELLALGIRLLGIMGLIKGVEQIAVGLAQADQFRNMFGEDGLGVAYLMYSAAPVVIFLLAFCLLLFPVSIAKWLIPTTKEEGPIFNGSAEDIQIAAFVVLGVYILSWAIPDFFYNAAMLLMADKMNYSSADKLNVVATEMTTVIEVGIGLYLCLQARGLNNLIRKLRRV